MPESAHIEHFARNYAPAKPFVPNYLWERARQPYHRRISSEHGAMATFGERLKQARQLAGVSQRQLGILAGIAPGSSSARMNQYERDTHEPPSELVRKLARVLGVPVPFFYAEKNEHAKLLLAYSNLPAPQRRKILADVRRAAAEALAAL